MKCAFKCLLLFSFLGFSIYGISQTTEEERIKKLQDSIINLPHMKAMFEANPQMKELVMQQLKAEQEQKQKVRTVQKVKPKNSNKGWYWENTIASTNNRFKEWSGGEADINMIYKGSGFKTFKIGVIKADGTIVFNLPNQVNTQTSLERQLGPQGLIFDIYNKGIANYTNKQSGFITNMSFPILQNGKHIGNLTIGNSVKVTKNLTTQSAIDSGDEGYILYWAYANEKCGINLNQNWNGEVRKDGTKTRTIQTTVNYNLNFKPGWNLIKTEVIGKYQLEHERGLDKSWFKSHRHSVIEGIPKNITYFFRKTPY